MRNRGFFSKSDSFIEASRAAYEACCLPWQKACWEQHSLKERYWPRSFPHSVPASPLSEFQKYQKWLSSVKAARRSGGVKE